MASSKRPTTLAFFHEGDGSASNINFKKADLISIDPAKEFLGLNVSQLANTLRERGKKNFESAKKHHANPSTLPVGKNQFLEMLSKHIVASPNPCSIPAAVEELRNQIKYATLIGEYGRFSSIIDSIEMIDVNETIIYFPIGRNPGNLPSKQYVNPQQVKNPLVTAMGGAPELWNERIALEKLNDAAEIFYKNNKKTLDELISGITFIAKFDSFYLPEAVVDMQLSLPDGGRQTLAIFESNATQVQGGQLMIAAPSGFPKDITQTVSSISDLKSALYYTHISGKATPKVQAMPLSLKQIYDETTHDLTKIHASPHTLFVSEKYQQKKLLDATKLAETRLRHLAGVDAIDASVQLPMRERGDITFLLGTEFDANFAVFQNSRDTASVTSHFHCYAIRLNDFLKDSHNVLHPIPLFKVNAEKILVRTESNNFPPVTLEKLKWHAACYRLSIPLRDSKDISAYFVIANMIKEIQDNMLTANPDCSFCYITRKDKGQMQFYMGVRKVIQNYAAKPLPNKTAESIGLQPPFNGSLEFAGINTMKGEKEFQAYLEVFNKNPQILLEIQKEALLRMSAQEDVVMQFERFAREALLRLELVPNVTRLH